MMIVGGIGFMALQPVLKDGKTNQAFESSMMPLRVARQRAIAERKQYIVCYGIAAPTGALTPVAPTAQSIQIFRWDAGTALSAAVQVTAVTLPIDFFFQVIPGVPNSAATVPDGFGIAGTALDFDQGVAGAIKNQVMFMPDGSAHDANGNLNSGILYVGTERRSLQFTGGHPVWRDRQNSGMAPDQQRGSGMDSAVRMTNMKDKQDQAPAKNRQQGFALLETLIAIVVLMIGLLAVLATFAMAIGNTNSVQFDSVARQKATEALESIFTARQTSQITFDMIQNVGAAPASSRLALPP